MTAHLVILAGAGTFADRRYPRDGQGERLAALLGSAASRATAWATARQEAFLHLHEKEAFYGGAAGGGKSVATLMAALQYSDVPGYSALIVRPSLAELQLAGGLIELAHDWLGPAKAHWSGETKTWRFPGRGRSGAGGATLTFGYLADASDVARYAGSSYSYLGFDELTRFEDAHYRRMFRVLRQSTGDLGRPAAPDGTRLHEVPVRIRATSNPGGPGHGWVKDRFVNPQTRHPGAVFLPSRIADNPHLDMQTYLDTLGELPTAELHRLMHGDWEIPDDGELFKREWFIPVEAHQLPPSGRQAVRYWDLAATEPSAANRDPDWSVGLRLERHRASGDYYITDIIRERRGPGAIEALVKTTAERDGRKVAVVIEQEPGAAGVQVTERYKRHVLAGQHVRAHRVTGDKHTRAIPVAAAAENGLIKIVRGRHTHAFLDELTAFPHGRHDDCVDALAGAHHHVTRYSGYATISIPRGQIPDPLDTTHTWADQHYPRDNHGERLAALLGVPLCPAPPPGLSLRTARRR